VILQTIGHDEKATEMPMLMVKKWLDQNLRDTQEGRTMRDGRILFLAKDETRVQKAEMNSRRLYDLCDIKEQRMKKTYWTHWKPNVAPRWSEAFIDGQRRLNGIHILTFATRELPDNVLCGYEQYSVKRFHPNPLRFEICCELGQPKNWCNRKENM
jgi:hypothetical protein